MQNLEQLTNRIAKLDPAKQSIVEKLVEKLEAATSPQPYMTLDQVIDEFEREHPELLRLLAQ